jgi:hypothetical protein
MMSKQKMENLTKDVKAFFYKQDEGGKKVWNKSNLYAVLIGGFVGWLFLTITFGSKLKALLKKVPVVNMLFKSKTYRKARRRVQQVGARRRVNKSRK